MTSYKVAIVLLNDLEEFADTHELPEAEVLIEKARNALEQDLGGLFTLRHTEKLVEKLNLVQ